MYRLTIVVGALLALTATTVIVRQDLVHFIFRTSVPSATPLSTNASPSGSSTSKAEPKLTFDVVRIDPLGASVFAGRAPPNSDVTILANDRAVTATKADTTGEWVAVTEREFVPGAYEFSLRAKSIEGDDVTTAQTVRIVLAPTAPRITPATTREAESAQAIPAPITFVYNETAFTKEGRQAVALLAKYLISQQPEAVSLSGHADERGSDHYNIELSRQRLEVVADYLRDRGFVGKLELIPKGRSEPYARIDRHVLSKEDAFQLDRRVELRQAR